MSGKSRKLEMALLLVTLIQRPRTWFISGFLFVLLAIMKFMFEGQSIFFENWQEIYQGLINPEVPMYLKLLIVSLFLFFTGLALYYTDLFKKAVLAQNELKKTRSHKST